VSLVAFASLSASSFVLARRFAGDPTWRGWTLYSIVTGILVAVFFVATSVTSILDASGVLANAPVGLLQRISIAAGFGLIALCALRLMSKGISSPSAHRKPWERTSEART